MSRVPGPPVRSNGYHNTEDYVRILASGKSPDGTEHVSSVIEGGGLVSRGYQQITTLSSAQPLDVPSQAVLAIIRPEEQKVRWRDDGVAPTASVGMPLLAGETFVHNGNLDALRFIEEATGAKLNVSYYGSPA